MNVEMGVSTEENRELLGDYSECEPPDSMSNSEVKLLSADDSVGFPHVKVGHCQAPSSH